MQRLGYLLVLCAALASSQTTVFPGTKAFPGTSTFGDTAFPFTIIDYSSCTNGSAPTTTQLGNSTFPSLASGASFSVTNTNTDVACDTTHTLTLPTYTPIGAPTWANNSTFSIKLSLGTVGDGVTLFYGTANARSTISACKAIYTDWPQNSTLSGRIDLWTLDTNLNFVNGQLNPTGTVITMSMECGDTPSGGNCVAGEFANQATFPTSQWELMCHVQQNGTSGAEYQGLWDPPSGSLCDGSLCSNGDGLPIGTIGTSTGTATTGSYNTAQHVFQLGTSAGTSGSHIWGGVEGQCGVSATQTACGFPLLPGLQLVAPTLSPGSGNYTTAQAVTITNISAQTDSYYYTTCTTLGCTPSTPTTASTRVNGTISFTPPIAVSAIAERGFPYNNPASPVTTANYVSPNATYVSTAQNSGAGVTSNAITGISIPSGDIIVAESGTASGGGTITITDSHSDTPQCGTTVTESGSNQGKQRICVFLAGATVTSVTCASTASNNQTCMAAWYTPGTLAGTLDQSTGQDQPNTTNWSSAATTTLAGSSDLVVGGYNCGGNTSVTSTPTDGSTSRLSSSTDTAMNLQDRTAWGTVGPAVTGTFSPAPSYCTGAVVAIK